MGGIGKRYSLAKNNNQGLALGQQEYEYSKEKIILLKRSCIPTMNVQEKKHYGINNSRY